MARFIVSLTILASVTLDAADERSVMNEARRFAEESGPADGFIDGWNSAYDPAHHLKIVDYSGGTVEAITPEDVERIG